MLSLYLPARAHPKRRPSVAEVTRWLDSVTQAQLVSPLTQSGQARLETLLGALDSGGPFGPELALKLSPGVGVMSLFDQDAQEQLLPAELSFEQLSLELAPAPTFLPLNDPELEVSCLRCGDALPLERFERALDALSFQPFEAVTLQCLSCDAPRGLRELSYDREVGFASAWLHIEECGSSRLNPVLLKAWGDALGAPLSLLVDQRDPVLDWQGGEEVTLAGVDHLGEGGLSFFEQGIKPSRALRKRTQQRGRGANKRRGRGRATGWEEL